ncbi:MAG: helix-turn-helix domain-containing protein [Actinomycetota bacterium]
MEPGDDKNRKGTDFGKFVKQLRKGMEMGQEEASEIAGMHITQWSVYEAGKSPSGMTIATLGKFAKALRVHPAILVAAIFKDNPFEWEWELPE